MNPSYDWQTVILLYYSTNWIIYPEEYSQPCTLWLAFLHWSLICSLNAWCFSTPTSWRVVFSVLWILCSLLPVFQVLMHVHSFSFLSRQNSHEIIWWSSEYIIRWTFRTWWAIHTILIKIPKQGTDHVSSKLRHWPQPGPNYCTKK